MLLLILILKIYFRLDKILEFTIYFFDLIMTNNINISYKMYTLKFTLNNDLSKNFERTKDFKTIILIC
jgi:hypothetical protein